MKFKNKYYVNRKQIDQDSLNTKQLSYPKEAFYFPIENYQNVDNNGLHYAFLGHSSVYLKIKNHTILIDPVFSKVIGPFSLFGMKRFNKENISADNFPDIDLVLISHNHYDHLDYKTIKSLVSKTKYFIVPLGIKKLLILFGVKEEKIIELNLNESFKYDDLDIVCTSAHHTSTRYIFDLDRTLWCSYVIKNKEYKVFHSGDTAFSRHFIDISRHYNHFDLAFIECGQYGSLWHNEHMFPEESVKACEILNCKLAIPIHWGSFRLANHSYDEPIVRFNIQANKKGINFQIPSIYKIYSI